MTNEIFQDSSLRGKTAFITGGSSGINLGIAEQFGQLGANVVILARSQDKIDMAVETLKSQGLEAMGISCDVRDYEGVEKALKKTQAKYGDIHCVIAGAAGNFLSPIVGLSSKGLSLIHI